MTSFYDITKKIRTALSNEPFVNTVSFGSIDDIDLNKSTIFPLSHIIINTATINTNIITYNVSILSMDIVDESKKETTNIFIGNDNEQDVLNTQLAIQSRIISLLQPLTFFLPFSKYSTPIAFLFLNITLSTVIFILLCKFFLFNAG